MRKIEPLSTEHGVTRNLRLKKIAKNDELTTFIISENATCRFDWKTTEKLRNR